ncbi:MAG: hypothetical protein KC466_06010, partial [Myxococcales bacterium]|nr:hypothetical protein [Myxococcales bacterium]
MSIEDRGVRWRTLRPVLALCIGVFIFGAGPAGAASICPDTPPDPTICPDDMPTAEEIDPVFLIGSATGERYYEDCGLVDQLVACGWPPDKVFTIYRKADPDCVDEGAEAMFAEV